MKKVKFLVLIIILLMFNNYVYAASCSLLVSSSSVYVGDSFTVSANMNGAAAWNIYVNSSGPVSGCSINEADSTSDANDTNKTFSVTCTATGEGTINLTLSGDVSSADDNSATIISGTKSVTVTSKPVSSNNNSNNYNNRTYNNSSINNKSINNNLKDISIDGYELTKVDDNNYTLSVSNTVTSININANAEDSKANVSGTGNHELNIGENNIELIITSESGNENKINVKVTRKDGYYIDDLDNLLSDNKVKDINIIIESGTKISSKDLKKIKDSKKSVTFSYYNSDKVLMYSWIINGAKIKNTNELVSSVSFDSNNKKDILKLSNYADGMYVCLNNSNKLSGNVKLRVYVGNKYSNDDNVNVYLYSNNKLELVSKNNKVEDGYIEFDVKSYSDYFITMSNINSETIVSNSNNDNSIPIISIIVILCIILILALIFIFRNKLFKKNNVKK